jgi:hypothetical protein
MIRTSCLSQVFCKRWSWCFELCTGSQREAEHHSLLLFQLRFCLCLCLRCFSAFRLLRICFCFCLGFCFPCFFLLLFCLIAHCPFEWERLKFQLHSVSAQIRPQSVLVFYHFLQTCTRFHYQRILCLRLRLCVAAQCSVQAHSAFSATSAKPKAYELELCAQQLRTPQQTTQIGSALHSFWLCRFCWVCSFHLSVS